MAVSGYDAVRTIAKERPEWMDVVRASFQEAQTSERFAGAWVLERLGRWAPSLQMLTRYGVIEKDGESTRGGRRAYYRMPDREGVARALRELGDQ